MLFMLIGVLAASYMYFVSFSIVHVVLQKETEQTIARATASAGAFEGEYLAKMSALTQDVAFASGFVAVKESAFASRKTLLTSALPLPRGL